MPSLGDTVGDRTGWTRRRRVLLAVVPLVALFLAAAAWAGWQTWQLADTLQELRGVAVVAQQHGQSGDLAKLRADLEQARGLAATGRRLAHEPAVRAATVLPWIGGDIATAAELADVAADLIDSSRGLDPVLDQLTKGKGLDLALAGEVRTFLAGFRPVATLAAQRIAAVDGDGVVLHVGDQLQRLGEVLAAVGPASDRLAPFLDAVSLLASPEAEHNWLVVLQNLGEARPSGGIVGSWLVVHTAGGSIKVVDQGANGVLVADGAVDYSDIMPEVYQEFWGDSLGNWGSTARR